MVDREIDEFDDDIEERRERVAGSRRLLIITLSVGCVALAISNIALAMRVTQLRRAAVVERPAVARAPMDAPAAAPERTTPEPAAPAASIPSQTPPPPPPVSTAPESAPAPTSAAPEAPAPETAPLTAPSRPPAPERATSPVATAPERVTAELPPRPAPRAQQRVASAQRTSERAPTAHSSPERATASWMVQEYGRLDAETRARAVADFYDAQSPEGAYWRRVLGEIVTARR